MIRHALKLPIVLYVYVRQLSSSATSFSEYIVFVMVDRLNKIVILFLCPLIVSARSLITNETICGMLPLHNGSMTALSHQEKVAYCKHFKPYVVNSVTKPDMCVAREDSMVKYAALLCI